MRKIRFRPDFFCHPPEENILQENNLYTHDGYLSYWNYHNTKVPDTIPAERLLVIRTDQMVPGS